MVDIAAMQPAETRPPGRLRTFLSAFAENKGAVLAAIIVMLVFGAGLFAEWIAPYPQGEQFKGFERLPPVWSERGDWRFLLGTDDVGRDMVTRLIYGGRFSLLIGLSVMLISVLVGVVLGLLSAWCDQKFQNRFVAFIAWLIDQAIMRLMDVITAVPSLVLAILIIGTVRPALEAAGYSVSPIVMTIAAITIVYLPRYVRIVRASAISELQKDYVAAARVSGVRPVRLLFRTILPNCAAPLIIQGALGISDAILEAAALGFLGLGAQPPYAEWGTMLASAREFILSDPWLVTLPGLAILITVVSINITGDGLRDALDPKLRRG
jgi:dipeptide transport system permease protein